MNLEQLVNASPAIKVLASTALPVKLAYRIARVIPKVDAELAAYGTARDGLLKQHGTLDKEGKMYYFEGDSLPLFQEGMLALNAEEVKIEFPKVKVSELSDIEMTAEHMAALDFMLEE